MLFYPPILVEQALILISAAVTPGFELPERVEINLADNLDAVDADREHPAVGAIGVTNDGAARQDVAIDLAVGEEAGL